MKRWSAIGACGAMIVLGGCDGDAGADGCPDGTDAWERAVDVAGVAVGVERWCARADGTAHGAYSKTGPEAVGGGFYEGLADGAWTWRDAHGELTSEAGFFHGLPDGEWVAYQAAADGGREVVYRHFFARGVACGTWQDRRPDGVMTTRELGVCVAEPGGTVPVAGQRAPLIAPALALEFACPGGAEPALVSGVAPWTVEGAADVVRVCVKSDGSGRYDGPWQHRVGARVVGEGAFDDGRRSGQWLTWFARRLDGSDYPAASAGLRSHLAYVDDRADGTGYEWREDGSASRLETWVDGVREGPYATWNAVGSPAEDGAYRGGREHGRWVTRFGNGVVAREVTWVDGQREGPFVTRFESGNVAEEGAYLAGLATGPWKTYYAWGQLETEANFVAGLRQGAFASFYPDGGPDAEGRYVDDLPEGTWVFRSVIDGVEIREEGSFVGGLQEGLWVGTYPSGARFSETEWRGGAREGGFKAYYESGAVGIDGHYADDVAHGAWRQWTEAGALTFDGGFVRGDKNGLCKRWWDSGGRRSEITFTLGVWHAGEALCWDESGAARECRPGQE